MKPRGQWGRGFVLFLGLCLLVGLVVPMAVARAGGGLQIDISDLSTTTTGTSATYTIQITGTLPSTAYVEYQGPPGFTVQSTSPSATNIPGTNRWRWIAEDLGSTSTLTVTGTHSVASGCVATHRVVVDDLYSPGQFTVSDETVTTLTDVLCVYLPVVLK